MTFGFLLEATHLGVKWPNGTAWCGWPYRHHAIRNVAVAEPSCTCGSAVVEVRLSALLACYLRCCCWSVQPSWPSSVVPFQHGDMARIILRHV